MSDSPQPAWDRSAEAKRFARRRRTPSYSPLTRAERSVDGILHLAAIVAVPFIWFLELIWPDTPPRAVKLAAAIVLAILLALFVPADVWHWYAGLLPSFLTTPWDTGAGRNSMDIPDASFGFIGAIIGRLMLLGLVAVLTLLVVLCAWTFIHAVLRWTFLQQIPKAWRAFTQAET